MILATVGTSDIPFDRFFRALDSLCEKGVLDGGELFAQTGKTGYTIRHYAHTAGLPRGEMAERVARADAVLCHAGTGTVVGALKAGKKVIVFPRLRRYGEHESDHQLELAREFTGRGYVLCARDEAELEAALRALPAFTPTPFVSNSGNFCNLVRSLIQR